MKGAQTPFVNAQKLLCLFNVAYYKIIISVDCYKGVSFAVVQVPCLLLPLDVSLSVHSAC